MGAFTASNQVPVVLSVHPPVLFHAHGPLAGKRAGGGNWRGVRCTLTGPASYDDGGSALPTLSGLAGRHIEAILVVAGDDATANADGNALRLTTATDSDVVRVFTSANAEVADTTNLSASSWEVLILGH
jgi:hypothetical protein